MARKKIAGIGSGKQAGKWFAVAATAALLAGATSARATVINFDTLASGTAVSNQYTSLGVTFAAGGGSIPGVVNPASTTQGFATNTDLTAVTLSSTNSSTAGSPLSGVVLRNYQAWINTENGDPVFTMTFGAALLTLSMDFGSVGASASQASLFAVNPATNTAVQIGLAPTAVNGTVTATGIPAGATTVIVLPGSYSDYVAIDNINFTTAAVPEPSTLAVSALGAGLLGVWLRRRRMAV